MARKLGTYPLSSNIEIEAGAPLDARTIVPLKADLTRAGSFSYSYVGMEVFVTEELQKYRLIGTNPELIDNWTKTDKGVVDGYYDAEHGGFYKDQGFTKPITGTSEVLYIDKSTDNVYRWNGSAFAQINPIDSQVPTIDMADERANIAQNDDVATIMGKIAKYFDDLGEVAFSDDYDDLDNTPTKLSEFENDPGYITDEGIVTSVKVGNTSYDPVDGVVSLPQYPDISGKADKATTLAGYGITDAKIASGTITLGANTITPLTSHQTVTDNNPTLSWGTKSKVATIGSTAINVTMPSNPNTDTKVTSVGNHYAPAEDSTVQLDADASSSTAATWNSTSLVTGVTVKRDAKGHVTGLAVDSIKMPANPNTNTTYTFSDGTNGFTVTPSGGTAQTVKVTPSITNNVTGSGTSGYLAKFNGGNTITSGPQLGSSTTTYLRNDGSWATPTDTKNTAGSTDTSSKIFLIGATSQGANPQTYSHDTAYVGTDGCLYSGGTKVLTSHQDISGKADKATTLAGYGITDAYIDNYSVTLGSKTLIPVLYTGNLTGTIGSGSPAADTKTYWENNTNIPINRVSIGYNTSGAEYSFLFSKGGSNSYGSVVKYGYNDRYLYILRINGGSWQSTDWEKMYAGYADSAGSATSATKATQDGDGNTISSTYMKKGVDRVTAGKKSGTSLGVNATAEGSSTTASGRNSHAEGLSTVASEYYAHAEGYETTASGSASHAEGRSHETYPTIVTKATGMGSHAEGIGTLASGLASHAEGLADYSSSGSTLLSWRPTTASGDGSHAEGVGTEASATASHAEGLYTTAAGQRSHAEGWYSTVTSTGVAAHAEGESTEASNTAAHAEGYCSVASGYYSHAEGRSTIAASTAQHVEGKYNVEDANDTYAHIIGGGSSTTRKNIFTVDWNGDVCAGRSNGLTNSTKLATGADVISYGFATAYHLGGTFNPYGFGGSLVVKRVRETGNLVRVRISMEYSSWKCFSGIIITRYGGCAFTCSMADNYSYDGAVTKLWGSETFTFSKGGTSSSSDVMYYDFKSSTGWNSFLVIGAISNSSSVPTSITVKGFTS